jgi:hypothetical protein
MPSLAAPCDDRTDGTEQDREEHCRWMAGRNPKDIIDQPARERRQGLTEPARKRLACRQEGLQGVGDRPACLRTRLAPTRWHRVVGEAHHGGIKQRPHQQTTTDKEDVVAPAAQPTPALQQAMLDVILEGTKGALVRAPVVPRGTASRA